MYKKRLPQIELNEFKILINPITKFHSITGKEYVVNKIDGNLLYFTRSSTNKEWNLNLEKLLKAYQTINIYKTTDFKPYFPRTQSPALALLIKTGLLIR